VTVKVGSGGAVNLFNSSGCTHSIVDVVGYYTAPTRDPNLSTVGTYPEMLHTSASANGRYIAVELYDPNTADNSNRRIEIHDTASGASVTLPEGGYYPRVSDTGRYVAYRRSGDQPTSPTVRLWDRTTNAVVALPPGGANHSGFLTEPDINADGSVVVWRSGGNCIEFACFGFFDLWTNVYRWDRGTGQTTQLTNHPAGSLSGPLSTQVVNDVEVSPDGSTVTFSVTDATSSPPAHTVQQWKNGQGVTSLTATAGPVEHVTASAGGDRVAYEVRLADPDDPGVSTFDVGVWSSAPGVVDPTPGNGNYGRPELSADGERLYMVSGGVEQFFAPTLVGDTLWGVTLDGSRTVSTTVANGWPLTERSADRGLLLWQPNTTFSDVVTSWAAGL
jgi:hypothetical protein